jgi:predicted dehydrogenase
MRTDKDITRRSFLKHTAGATAAAMSFPYIVSSSALGKAGAVAPSNRVVMGAIGTGGQGRGVMGGFLGLADAQVVAVCDVKRQARELAQQQVNKRYGNDNCRTYNDFRELLARDDMDAVSIASTDHWHVPLALAAARAGKDMYVEKPLGLSVQQGQVLRETINSYGRVFQFGTQQRSERNFRFACELALNGRLGKLHTINVWAPGSASGGSPKPAPVPEGIDYDLWLGPAPYTPYTPDRCSNSLWWFISDYAIGFIAGWGIHPVDIAIWGGGQKTDCPVEVEGAGVWPSPDGVCDTAMNWNVTLKYDSGVTMNFTGDPPRQEWRNRYKRTTSHGTAFEGDKGWVHVDRSGINAHPESLLQEQFGQDEIRLPVSSHHQKNLIDCIKSRGKPVSPIEDAVRGDIVCLISDIAIRLRRKLKWDPVKELFVNDEQANRMLKRSMRSPWRL